MMMNVVLELFRYEDLLSMVKVQVCLAKSNCHHGQRKPRLRSGKKVKFFKNIRYEEVRFYFQDVT